VTFDAACFVFCILIKACPVTSSDIVVNILDNIELFDIDKLTEQLTNK
jgi:hypothetical protein